jgi:hypothetical protein
VAPIRGVSVVSAGEPRFIALYRPPANTGPLQDFHRLRNIRTRSSRGEVGTQHDIDVNCIEWKDNQAGFGRLQDTGGTLVIDPPLAAATDSNPITLVQPRNA